MAEKGIRCKSGTVPATVSVDEMRTPLESIALSKGCGYGKAQSRRKHKSVDLPIIYTSFNTSGVE
jgi:hypothetical protein